MKAEVIVGAVFIFAAATVLAANDKNSVDPNELVRANARVVAAATACGQMELARDLESASMELAAKRSQVHELGPIHRKWKRAVALERELLATGRDGRPHPKECAWAKKDGREQLELTDRLLLGR